MRKNKKFNIILVCILLNLISTNSVYTMLLSKFFNISSKNATNTPDDKVKILTLVAMRNGEKVNIVNYPKNVHSNYNNSQSNQKQYAQVQQNLNQINYQHATSNNLYPNLPQSLSNNNTNKVIPYDVNYNYPRAADHPEVFQQKTAIQQNSDNNLYPNFNNDLQTQNIPVVQKKDSKNTNNKINQIIIDCNKQLVMGGTKIIKNFKNEKDFQSNNGWSGIIEFESKENSFYSSLITSLISAKIVDQLNKAGKKEIIKGQNVAVFYAAFIERLTRFFQEFATEYSKLFDLKVLGIGPEYYKGLKNYEILDYLVYMLKYEFLDLGNFENIYENFINTYNANPLFDFYINIFMRVAVAEYLKNRNINDIIKIYNFIYSFSSDESKPKYIKENNDKSEKNISFVIDQKMFIKENLLKYSEAPMDIVLELFALALKLPFVLNVDKDYNFFPSINAKSFFVSFIKINQDSYSALIPSKSLMLDQVENNKKFYEALEMDLELNLYEIGKYLKLAEGKDDKTVKKTIDSIKKELEKIENLQYKLVFLISIKNELLKGDKKEILEAAAKSELNNILKDLNINSTIKNENDPILKTLFEAEKLNTLVESIVKKMNKKATKEQILTKVATEANIDKKIKKLEEILKSTNSNTKVKK